MNSRYQVAVHEYASGTWEGMPLPIVQLSIKRHDKREIRDWRDFQRIKTEILGPDAEAAELFPAETRLVDTANQYHLWCLPKGDRFPFGYFDGRLVAGPVNPDGTCPSGSRQRPFEDGPPEGAINPLVIAGCTNGNQRCPSCGNQGDVQMTTGDARCACGATWNVTEEHQLGERHANQT